MASCSGFLHRSGFPRSAAVACLVWAAAAVLLGSCEKLPAPGGGTTSRSGEAPAGGATQTSAGASAGSAAELVSRGRVVYQSTCIACHNPDPHKAGSLGPEIWGSSLELIQTRVAKAEYPAGYTPKRQTHVMQALPQVTKDVPALHAYLNAR